MMQMGRNQRVTWGKRAVVRGAGWPTRTVRFQYLLWPRGVVGHREPRLVRIAVKRQKVRQTPNSSAGYDLLLALIRACMYVTQRQEPPPCITPNS